MTNPAAAVQNFWLSIWPVAQRELRAGSHTAWNYWLRVIGGGASVIVVYVAMNSRRWLGFSQHGQSLFTSLHLTVLGLILLTVPAMTADCLARERREGTLGLLFLTPLTPGGVVIGKGLYQGLRAWCLWLTVLPALTIPLALGGLTWTTIAMSFALQLCLIIIALASGLLASSIVNGAYVAIALAEILAGLISALLFDLIGYEILIHSVTTSVRTIPAVGMDTINSGFIAASGMQDFYYGVRVSPMQPYLMVSANLAFAFLFLAFVLFLAAWRLRSSWQDKPPSPFRQWLIRTFCTGLSADNSRGKTGRMMDKNPIAWLQQYSWKARTAKWVLCLGFVLAQAITINGNLTRHFQDLYIWLLIILAVLYTYSGVNSFMAEKSTGVLELILISPVPVHKLIFGRALGLWNQFLPATASLLLFPYVFLWTIGEPISPVWQFNCTIIAAYLSLPIYATYAALRVKRMMFAIALSWTGLLLAHAFSLEALEFVQVFGHQYWNSTFITIAFVASNLALVGLTCFLLHHSLSRRIYSF